MSRPLVTSLEKVTQPAIGPHFAFVSRAMLDPTDPTSFNQRFVLIPRNGHRYHLVDQAPPSWVGPLHEAPTLLLLHGFPDLWYGWRYRSSPPLPSPVRD